MTEVEIIQKELIYEYERLLDHNKVSYIVDILKFFFRVINSKSQQYITIHYIVKVSNLYSLCKLLLFLEIFVDKYF